ncbi:hypothetical protein F4694_002999 [Bacillus niacini]|uniref:Antigen I/II N-terminal domain-containing protein n=1 Tax=Neobacillus niacini TaxID=86668 RepID=A0A852TDX3_9BACI|nr:hypothetical protein [Neobacillus niacini]NYE06219.1 hypothetical protein [Neobacillus niacini]
MKKLTYLFMAFLLVFLAACSSNETTSKEENETKKEEKKKEQGVEVDKGLLNVELTIPASMFEGENVDTVISEAKAEGIDVTKNEDGSLKYKISKSQHKKMMEEMEKGIKESLEEMVNGEEFVSLQEITYNDSFSEFTVLVDKAAYENSFDGFALLGLGISGMMYQYYNGTNADDVKVKVITKDQETQEVIGEVVYPDALEETETEAE